MNLNHVYIAGRLTRDPEIKTPSGTVIATVSVAVNRYLKDAKGEPKEETDFIEVTAFGQNATTIQKHLRKGNSIFLEGRLRLDKWEDRETGKQRSKIVVVAERMQFVGPKPQTQEGSPKQALGLNEYGEPTDIPY